jgi:hypothetical protein
MKRQISIMIALALTVSLVLVSGAYSQMKKEPVSGLDRLDGTVQSIDKATSTITIRQRGTINLQWQIVYSKDTRFTYRNGPSSFDEVKEGRRVICLGKGEGTGRLVATRVDIRTK